MNGDRWTPRLSEYVDGALSSADREALEQHLAACEDCRETVEGLRRVRKRAAAVEDRPPQVDLWPGIARRIGVASGARVPARRAQRRWSLTLPQLAAAAVVLVAVGAGTLWVVQKTVGAAPTAPVTALQAPPGLEGRFASIVPYDAAVADLEQVYSRNRDRLDTVTVRVLEESLAMIDRAIERARAALAADPSDAYLNTYLADTMRRKVALLRRAADIASASL